LSNPLYGILKFFEMISCSRAMVGCCCST